jgi:hypothetical protein
MVPPLWERLRDRTPLFRSDSKRAKARESDLPPHRFITPASVEPAPENPLVSEVEAKGAAAPPSIERESDPAPRRFVAPVPVASRQAEEPTIPEAEASRSIAAPPIEPEHEVFPRRFIAPPPAERRPEKEPLPAVGAKRSIAPSPTEPEMDRVPQRILAPAPVARSSDPAPQVAPQESAPAWQRPATPFAVAAGPDLPRAIITPPLEHQAEIHPIPDLEQIPVNPPRFESELETSRFQSESPQEKPRALSSLVEGELRPILPPRLEPEAPQDAAHIPAASPVEQTPEFPMPSSRKDERRWTLEPKPFLPEVHTVSPRFAAPPPMEHATEWPSGASETSTQTIAPPTFEVKEGPLSPRHITSYRSDRELGPSPVSAPEPGRSRHWSTLFNEDLSQRRIEPDMESRRAAPPAPVERRQAITAEAAPEPREPLREAIPPAPEPALRESAVSSGIETRRSATVPSREPETVRERQFAEESISAEHESMLSRDTVDTVDEDDSEESRNPVFPKLLKRLATVGRAALPIVPHVLPREGRIGATVSAVTAVSSALAARAAQHTQAGQTAPAAPKIDLAPIGDNLDVMRIAQKELRDKVVEQSAMIERVQDQVDILRESSNRLEVEQRELVAELKFFSRWSLVFAVAVSVLLMATVAFEVVLILRQ